jgi:alcohol dehydrogenase (cytochrome c)
MRTSAGAPRKLLAVASRNGFFYVLDRLTGEMLRAEPFVKNLTWASGIGADGRPKLLPGYENTADGTQTCPAVSGAANWPSSAFNRPRSVLRHGFRSVCGVPKEYGMVRAGKVVLRRNDKARDHRRRRQILRALDLQSGKLIWEVPKVAGSVTGSV